MNITPNNNQSITSLDSSFGVLQEKSNSIFGRCVGSCVVKSNTIINFKQIDRPYAKCKTILDSKVFEDDISEVEKCYFTVKPTVETSNKASNEVTMSNKLITFDSLRKNIKCYFTVEATDETVDEAVNEASDEFIDKRTYYNSCRNRKTFDTFFYKESYKNNKDDIVSDEKDKNSQHQVSKTELVAHDKSIHIASNKYIPSKIGSAECEDNTDKLTKQVTGKPPIHPNSKQKTKQVLSDKYIPDKIDHAKFKDYTCKLNNIRLQAPDHKDFIDNETWPDLPEQGYLDSLVEENNKEIENANL